MTNDVMIAVDRHKGSNTLAVLDPVTKTPIDGARFENDTAGYDELMSFARRWDERRWAVEGCHGAGRSLAQRLVADGEVVYDVPPKLAARVRVFSLGHGRKTDKDDAVSIGRVAIDGEGIAEVAKDDTTVSLRLLCDRREELGALRTQAVCRLHRLLAELTPGGMRQPITALKAEAVLAKLRPTDEVGAIRLQLAHEHLEDIKVLDAKMKKIGGEIAVLVKATGSSLTELYGVGSVIAGRLLAEVGDVRRFPTKDKFATYDGTAPLDVSSGDQVRHRLSRAGNRRINHALHMMAVTQIRHQGSPGRSYYERKRLEGKTPKEALRCLKRRLSDVVCRQLVSDRKGRIAVCELPTIVRPTPSTSTSPTNRSRQVARAPQPTRPTACRPSSSLTGRTTASLASRSSTRASDSTPTSSRKRKSSAERVAS